MVGKIVGVVFVGDVVFLFGFVRIVVVGFGGDFRIDVRGCLASFRVALGDGDIADRHWFAFQLQLRLQFADTNIELKELEPPSVATDLLPGQRESSFAMPLEDYIAEVISILESDPDAKEIQVERVKFLRYAEARGDYDAVVSTLNASDPHGGD